MGRHSAPDDDGDLLVEPVAPADVPARPRPRPRHAVAGEDAEPESAALVDTELDTEIIEPEVVERAPQPSAREVIDADVVEDEPVPAPAPFATPPELPGGVAAAEPAAEPAAVPRERATRSDLRMLRQDRALRARAIAAVVVPFVLYTVVLAVLGRLEVYLFWIWIPAILAGVLFGAQLDAAVRKVADLATDQGTSNPERPAP